MSGGGARPESPLFPGVIHGVRAWAVDRYGLLRGAGNGGGTPWTPDGGATDAYCLRHRHPAPRPDCSCGLYALHPSRLDWGPGLGASSRRRARVFGIVEAWGAIELHSRGFRARHARPVVLFRPAAHETEAHQVEAVDRVTGRYDVRVVELPRPDRMAQEWCERNGIGLQPRLIRELLRPAHARRGGEDDGGELGCG